MITERDIVLRKGREVVCKIIGKNVRYFRYTYDTSMTRLENKRSSSFGEYNQLIRLWKK